MFRVLSRLRQQLVGDFRIDLRASRPDHFGNPNLGSLVLRVALVQLVGDSYLGGVDVLDGKRSHPAVLVTDVHRAPVGQRDPADRGDGQPRHPLEGCLVVERGTQDRPGLGQEALRLLLQLSMGDVRGDADHADDGALLISKDASSSLDPVQRPVGPHDAVLELVA